jgi:hypothetical protein
MVAVTTGSAKTTRVVSPDLQTLRVFADGSAHNIEPCKRLPVHLFFSVLLRRCL